jgi:transcriptional regulator with GAF, ATPase, and Fis domain
VDTWLPDLDLNEFLGDFRGSFPGVDLVTAGGLVDEESPRGPYRQELLYALRSIQDTDSAVWNGAPSLAKAVVEISESQSKAPAVALAFRPVHSASVSPASASGAKAIPIRLKVSGSEPSSGERLPELVGNADCMLEISRRVRLVAPRTTPVLIEGPTGSGKELVAEALHRLSKRSRKPLIAINCAAIPEALLEAELFGHTRGAFTGAVQGRTGRIEAADGGTLFLDEIGEMPLSLQSKLLRFVECGELQRVGENEAVKVDVRIIAATHRPLAQQAQDGGFRADLYYRLAVFLIRTPALVDHAQDLPLLVQHFLDKMGRDTPLKRIDPSAMAKLAKHDWPGNVRELEHVLERAMILAGENPVLTSNEIDFGLTVN